MVCPFDESCCCRYAVWPSTHLLVVWCCTLYGLNRIHVFNTLNACVVRIFLCAYICVCILGCRASALYICTHHCWVCVACLILTCHILWLYDVGTRKLLCSITASCRICPRLISVSVRLSYILYPWVFAPCYFIYLLLWVIYWLVLNHIL